MPRQKARVTIHEVARRAGVSVATVSRVFNNSDLVTKQTGEKIRSVARRLNYIPNASARSLSMKRTETIGMLLPDMHGEFFSEIIRGADAIAHKEQYHLLVSASHSNKEELETAIKMMSGRVDGFILMSPHLDSETLVGRYLKSVPTVILTSSEARGMHDSIRIDNVGAARQVMRHLISLGHRRIAIVKGDPGNEDAEERLAGYHAELRANSIDVTDELIVCGDFTERSGHAAGRILLDLKYRPTAVFASNDEMAIGVLRCFREEGIKVPQEIAVAGFDDIQISSLIHPSLTSVHVDISDLGSLAAERLIEVLADGTKRKTVKSIVLPSRLVVRNSTLTTTHADAVISHATSVQ
ncbi:MAG: LacI family DNA-binding transcriptional regulator [Ignavibacteriales bacterium]|nr:LacI family DNA-binding transcriptional regulator [Ignavibacteriales bacterium]